MLIKIEFEFTPTRDQIDAALRLFEMASNSDLGRRILESLMGAKKEKRETT